MGEDQVGNMRPLSNVYLHLALTTILLSPLPLSPTVAQIGAEPGQSGSYPAAIDNDISVQTTDSEAVETVVIKGEALASALGREVRTKAEEDMGRIVDLLCDRTGRVKAAVIEFGGFLGIGTRKIAVEWSALRFDAASEPPVVILDMTRDRLHGVPDYKPRAPAVIRKTATEPPR